MKRYIHKGVDTNYFVDESGNVFSHVRKKVKKLKNHSYTGGYLINMLVINGKRTWVQNHRLVALLYVENTLNKKEVNHIDRDKKNNHFSNLEWVTPSENVKHYYSTAPKKTFRTMSKSKLNEFQLLQVKQMLSEGIKGSVIARKYNVSQTIISNIKHGKSHRI